MPLRQNEDEKKKNNYPIATENKRDIVYSFRPQSNIATFQILLQYHHINMANRRLVVEEKRTLRNGFVLDSECVVGTLYVHAYVWPPPKIEDHLFFLKNKNKKENKSDSTSFLFHNVIKHGGVTGFSSLVNEKPAVLVRYPASLVDIGHDSVMAWIYGCVLCTVPFRVKWNASNSTWSAYYSLGSRHREQETMHVYCPQVQFEMVLPGSLSSQLIKHLLPIQCNNLEQLNAVRLWEERLSLSKAEEKEKKNKCRSYSAHRQALELICVVDLPLVIHYILLEYLYLPCSCNTVDGIWDPDYVRIAMKECGFPECAESTRFFRHKFQWPNV